MEITHFYSEEKRTYEVQNFDKVKEDYKEWVAKNFHLDLVVSNEETYKFIYKERTTINKEIAALKNDLKVVDSIILGNFKKEVKELLSMLTDVQSKLTEKIEDFKKSESEKEPKEMTYTVNFTTKDEEIYNKIIEYIKTLVREN